MSILNRVAESGLIQFDPATLVKDAKVTIVSLSSFLNEDKILREKPFRQAIAAHDWTIYKDQYVGLHIAEDTLVPQWAAMLMTSHLESHAAGVCLGDQDAATALAYESALTTLKVEDYKQKVSQNYIIGQAYNKGGYQVLSRVEADDPNTGKRR